MPLPASFIAHLQSLGYHPRSNKHSDALATAIALDLVAHCPAIAEAARTGRIVYDLNFTIVVQRSDWNIDLGLGPPPPGAAGATPSGIVRARPSTVQVAVEIKSVMTEHRKAVKNRKRDFEAHHEHAHEYNRRTIAAGVMVTNMSATFRSPLRTSETTHRNVESQVQHCLNEMRNVASRSGESDNGLDAKTFIVVEMDNVNLDATRFVIRPPAPQIGDPLHYDAFIERICDTYTERFAR